MQYDTNSLELPSIVQPTLKQKGKPYMITSIPIKITKELGIDENTPLLWGIIPGTKTSETYSTTPEFLLIYQVSKESVLNKSMQYIWKKGEHKIL